MKFFNILPLFVLNIDSVHFHIFIQDVHPNKNQESLVAGADGAELPQQPE